MSRSYSIVSNTTVGDRLLYVGQDSVQLSTGDCVFLACDPSQANPNKISLYVATGATRGTQTLVATLNASTAVGGVFIIPYAKPQCLALCKDADDNLYVVGGYGALNSTLIAYQAFIKQSGLVWQPATPNVCLTPASSTLPPVGYTAVWCNTGGGGVYPPITGTSAGHVMVAANTNDHSVTNACYILSAAIMLTGAAQYGTVVVNPAFIGDSAGLYGCNLDISQQGFGATAGACLSANGTSAAQFSLWGVSSTGALTTGGGTTLSFPTGTLTGTTKLRIAYSSALGAFVCAFPSSSNAGQVTVLTPNYTPTLGTQLSVDTGTASNFPAPSASLSWDLSTDPDGNVWIYGWSSATATTMLRVPVTFPAGVPTLGTVVSDDTGVGVTSTTIRTVKEPIDWFHADWQSYDTTSPYSLEGDYSALPVAPQVPALVTPANNAAAPYASGGLFDWNFTSVEATDAQVTYYLRFHTMAGYQWWNGSALTTAQTNPTGGNEVAVTSATTSATLPSSILSTGAWAWSVQVTGASGVFSGYSTAWIVNVVAQPGVPSLSGSYDSTNNRVILTVGGLSAYDTWVEYSDDLVNWYNIRDASGTIPATLVGGVATVYDWEPPALTPATRNYRALQWNPSAAVMDNYSPWSSYLPLTWPVPPHFILRDPLLMSYGVQAQVLANTLTTSYGENLTEHNPLGNPATVIVADVVGLEDGAATLFTETAAAEAALLALLLSQHTLLFQTPDGRCWFTRWNAPRPVNTPYLVSSSGHREHALTWRGQVRPPA